MPRPRLAAAALLLLGTPVVARAQDKDAICRNVQNRPLRVGQWATYGWTGGRTDGATIRFAVVGSEAYDGTTYYWYEVSMNDPGRGAKGKTVFQMLVPGLGYQASSVRALIMKSGDDPAVRMPDAMVRMVGSRVGANVAAEVAQACQRMEVVGWEQVTVPAGTFKALHLRDANEPTEAWLRPELDFAMVKVVMKDGSTMSLTGSGGGAKSSIAEQPLR